MCVWAGGQLSERDEKCCLALAGVSNESKSDEKVRGARLFGSGASLNFIFSQSKVSPAIHGRHLIMEACDVCTDNAIKAKNERIPMHPKSSSCFRSRHREHDFRLRSRRKLINRLPGANEKETAPIVRCTIGRAHATSWFFDPNESHVCVCGPICNYIRGSDFYVIVCDCMRYLFSLHQSSRRRCKSCEQFLFYYLREGTWDAR